MADERLGTLSGFSRTQSVRMPGYHLPAKCRLNSACRSADHLAALGLLRGYISFSIGSPGWDQEVSKAGRTGPEYGLMVVENTAGAQIQLIYASNDMSDARQLKIDLHASRYAYLFHQFANPATLVTSLNELVQKSGQYIPTVLVISYKFAGDTSEALLQIARIASQNFAVECVIIDLPSDAGIRRRMKDLGATIFDGNVERLSVEFTLH